MGGLQVAGGASKITRLEKNKTQDDKGGPQMPGANKMEDDKRGPQMPHTDGVRDRVIPSPHTEGKLAPRYIGPFKILDRRGEVAYQLELSKSLSGVHDVFHVSQLKKCLRVPEEQIPLEELTIKEDLTYEKFPVKILETAKRVMRSRVIKMCKV